jgi:uncharacterized beta-barrel protein YwiB (DUF1934 family)
MQKDVLISIKGTVIPEDPAPPDIIELVTAGRYYSRGGAYYITYSESTATGLEGVVTTVKVEGENSVTLSRSGAARSRLVLERGRRHLCQYDSGYGHITIGVSGCKIKSKLNDFGGELSFYYTLNLNSTLVSQNQVSIKVKEANAKDVQPGKCSN